MMIDFSKIVELVPNGGRLVLTFTAKADKKDGDEGPKIVSVVFAQQFKGKENDNDFSPIIITGNAINLTDSFESTIADIARDQKRLAELKTTTTGRIDQKKKQLSDAIQKHTKAADPNKAGEQREEKKPEVKEVKPKPVMADLFSMSPARPAVPEIAPAVTVSESEAAQHDVAEGVHCG